MPFSQRTPGFDFQRTHTRTQCDKVRIKRGLPALTRGTHALHMAQPVLSLVLSFQNGRDECNEHFLCLIPEFVSEKKPLVSFGIVSEEGCLEGRGFLICFY